MAIKIDIPVVEAAADKIAVQNISIRRDFSDANDAMNTLNRNWDGVASDKAIRAFNSIRENFCDYRYSVISDMVSFLKVKVSADYQKTEKEIKKNAALFK